MDFICVIPKDLRVKQEILLGRDLKEIGLIFGAALGGFIIGFILAIGNPIGGTIGCVVGLLLACLITQPITTKQNTLYYMKTIHKYHKSQKIYKTAPLSMHIEAKAIETEFVAEK